MGSCDDELLKLHSDTVSTLRKLYKLDKREDMDRAIDALEDWLKKQYHFTKREYPREYLERSIIFMKGSVERVKLQISNLCSMRTIFPNFFEKVDAINDFVHYEDPVWIDAFLPKLTKDNYRVYVMKFMKDGVTSDMLLDMYKLGVLKTEYVKAHDYANGFIGIIDYRNINIMSLISAINIITTHQIAKIIMEGYGLRIKGIHSISSSKAIKTLAKLLKPILSPKIFSRIHIHSKIESLYDHVPKEILPMELGGSGESLVPLTGKKFYFWLLLFAVGESSE
ncbi:hypothetical protein O3G_MSEX011684 [Manduca sexta]|uniref:CRAL-TRIO domain-containing protein n=1 Tax=Manduca sexta TaxID=7130 RepID=A0A921ZKY7_MANSE|nr:hypothetical protein O3G_MSEX011684 [Manduca sexta]